MLLRLLIALLVILPTLPAAAGPACHAPPPAGDRHGMHAIHAEPAPPPAEPQRSLPDAMLCVGCVAPATLGPVRTGAALTAAAVPPLPRNADGRRGPAPLPATPPPKRAG